MLSSITGINLVYLLIAIIFSLSIHEAMHAYTGHLLGDTTAQDMGRLSLNPLRHIDPFTTVLLPIISLVLFQLPILAAKPVPFNPNRLKFDEYGAALVAIAGPASNLIMAFIGALLIREINLPVVLYNFLNIFVDVNVAIFIFNIIPIPPLDGSRVVYSLAPESVQNFMNSIEPYGIFIIFALVLSHILTPLLVPLNNAIINILP